MKAFSIVAIFLTLLVAGCAHHRDVRAGADGVHRVVVQTDNQEEGAQNAIAQANHFCEQRNLSAAFIDEKKDYTGDMKESDYKKAKTTAKVVQAAGGAAWVFGGKRESTVGGIAGIGGGIADHALGNAYNVEMRFKCQ
jgi:hypothetical protein